MRIRADVAELLRQDVSQRQIVRRLGVTPLSVQQAREALGLSAPRTGRRYTYASLEDAFRHGAEPMADGHVQWVGYRDKDGTPRVCYRQQPQAAPRVAFVLHNGREPVGKALPTCGMKGCIAGAHLADRPMREANQRADDLYGAIFGGPGMTTEPGGPMVPAAGTIRRVQALGVAGWPLSRVWPARSDLSPSRMARLMTATTVAATTARVWSPTSTPGTTRPAPACTASPTSARPRRPRPRDRRRMDGRHRARRQHVRHPLLNEQRREPS
jgi:hypothetical protein